MIPLWSPRNVEHLAKHDVEPGEAEEVVAGVRPPYPQYVGDEKWSIWGVTSDGRFLQVIFVLALLEDVEPDEFAILRVDEQVALEQGEPAIRIIHARDLTDAEKRRLRRRRRG